jgi:hypothetical protein
MTLKIRNWDRWQSYRKDRGQPPWIKVHRALMRDPNWVSLTDAQRGQIIAIWMLAADRDGTIPSCPLMVRKLCMMDGDPDLNLFIEKGFIDGCQVDATVSPERRQHVSPETETETETEADIRADAREDVSRETVPIESPAAEQPQHEFDGVIIKLRKKHFEDWTKAYSFIDLRSELTARDAWLASDRATDADRKNWFISTSKYLANRNQEAKTKANAARAGPKNLRYPDDPFDWRNAIT